MLPLSKRYFKRLQQRYFTSFSLGKGFTCFILIFSYFRILSSNTFYFFCPFRPMYIKWQFNLKGNKKLLVLEPNINSDHGVGAQMTLNTMLYLKSSFLKLLQQKDEESHPEAFTYIGGDVRKVGMVVWVRMIPVR